MTSAPFHVVLATCFLLSWSLQHPYKLQFTRTFYNVTIPENSVSRTLVTSNNRMGILRRSTEDDVTFRIVTGDPDRIFKVDSKPVGDFIFLVLRTKGGNPVVINRERKDKFVLTVKAFSSRSSLEATTIIYVRVEDQNDLTPIFFPSNYNETLPEDFSLHNPVLKVAAEDADLGVNGEVMYWIKEPTEYFAIHPSMGIVTLTKRLKYAERSVHELTIVAQDRATIFRGGGQFSLAKVSVRVKQVNLFGPEIYVYVLQDPSAHKLGLVCAVVRVVDRDEGMHGEIDNIRIVEGDPLGIFIIDPVDESKNKSRNEYSIILANSAILGRTPAVYNLSLQVLDKGFPQRMSYKAVSIRVVNDSDAEPYFERELYVVNVPEYIPQGTPLLRLTLINRNQLLSDEIILKIVDGNPHNAFRINQRTITLYTNLPLDAEEHRKFTLTVAVIRKENIEYKHASTTKIKINVIDSNDNDPVFIDIPKEVSVAENEPAGTHVFRVSASDSDSEDNGVVTYRIANLKFVPFEIDPLSGVLRTIQPLDYESMRKEFNVRIRASDSGTPFRRESEKIITVKIRNINDNSPIFTKGDCSLSIPRNLLVGTKLFPLSATDMDEMDTITYSISSLYRDDCFRIEISRGFLSLECNLSEVTRTEWELNVTASDGTFKTETSVRVFVSSPELSSSQISQIQYSCRELDSFKEEPNHIEPIKNLDRSTIDNMLFKIMLENLHDPVITGLPKRFTVEEAVPVNTTVFKVTALDNDEGFNGNLVYGMICDPDDSVFKIDPDSGEISVFYLYGDENQSMYNLNISVCDQGSPTRCTSDTASIAILRGKNKPRFPEELYKVHIFENTETGSELVVMEAIGFNITYSIVSITDHFRIDSKTGAIFLKAPLDRETVDRHSITVRAAGSDTISSEPNSSDVIVTFYVNDVNDNAPAFVNTLLEAFVREDVPKGSVVFIVNTLDEDLGSSGEVIYSLPESDLFSIDSSTGTVRLQGRLDYETKRQHRVLIEARDKGTPSLSSQAVLTVTVVDVNENLNPPMFDEVVVVRSVKENLPPGTLVTTVTSVDADLPGPDSKIIYSIREGDALAMFTVTEQGNILTSAVLDAEVADHYWLTVVAEDCGLLPLSASVQVYIIVENENDLLPLTTEPSYHMRVEENLPSHSPVGHVTSRDDVIYTLLHPVSGRLPFSIDMNSGLISTSALLDREENEEYTFQVMTSERAGTGRSGATTEVLITVVDVNDHAPQFDSDHYIVRLPHVPQPLPEKLIINETEQVSYDGEKWIVSNFLIVDSAVPFFQVLATDLDYGGNGSVLYSIQNTAYFVLHSKTGLIYPRTRLTPGREYEIFVKANDAGDPNRSSTAKVTVYCPHKSHTPKKLATQDLVVNVRENILPGEILTKFNVSFTDKELLNFVITGGNGTRYLAIRGEALLVARRLDCEHGDTTLGLTVRATNVSAIWNIKIIVKIDDINEFPPKFSRSVYNLNVSEVTPTGTVLTVLEASDLDLKSNLSFHIYNSDPGSDMFTVDSTTGEFVLKGPLDREVCRSHRLTVVVSDGGEIPRFGYTRIMVQVEDTNDNKPLWPKDTLSLTVVEDAPPGSVLTTLTASDRDAGENGVVVYSIISGNKNSTLKIHPETGVLQLVKHLTWLESSEFTIVIRGQDRGYPSISSDMSLHIKILQSDKSPPRCSNHLGWFEISEKSEVGKVVGKVSTDSSPLLLYDIVTGDPQGRFKINPYCGDILLERKLEYETVSQYNLSIAIINMAGIKSFCNIIIYVLDYNNNPPVFKKDIYSGYIEESAIHGSFIMTEEGPLRILAEDVDSGINGLVVFKIKESSQMNLLTIDPITGAVRTAAELDYEQLAEINVLLSAADLGQPSLRSETLASLQVHIKDVNDCPPVFSHSVYNATVVLPTYKGVLVVQVVATDPDSAIVTKLRYSISSGTEDLGLRVDKETGEIFVDDPLKLRPRRIKVLVDDGKHQDSASVEILIGKREPSVLRFQKDIYHAAVLENSTKTSVVAVVSVLGSRINEDIHFSLLNPSPNFSIGRTSGIVSTGNVVFDREQLDHYILIVQAYSMDRKLTAYTEVNVSVLDANDNCPYFLNLPYRATLTTNATKGDFVFKVVAKDLDTGDNGEVRYELDQTGLDLFRVGRKSGEIRLKSLSVYNRLETQVLVTATDGGIVPCATSTTLTVLMINAQAPLWERMVYKAQIVESAPLLSAVPVSFKAAGVNRVVYQLVNSNDFLLHHSTGVLQVLSELDREGTALYSLTVRATDAVTRLSADTLLLLEVTDVNDCPPEFLQESYQVQVSEDAEVGTTVSRVTAVDRDKGINAEIHYSMDSEFFQIDSKDGSIFLQQELDYEICSFHHLTVYATDSGVPQLTSIVSVLVQVLNRNDNSPVITDPTLRLKVSQVVPRGAFVGRILVRDEDGDELNFRITSQEEHIRRAFALERNTGIISVLNPTHLLEFEVIYVNFTVDDGLHSTSGAVEIQTLPANRRAPHFDKTPYRAVLQENLPSGQVVVKVVAIDGDIGAFGNITYSLPSQRSSEYFSIDRFTGELLTRKPLDREIISFHQLHVKATDGGGLMGWVSVEVNVLDENDNKPVFELPSYVSCVSGDLTANQTIIKVKAVDADAGLAGEVKYSVMNAEPRLTQDWFRIHPQEGVVTVTRPITLKEIQVVKMTLRAADCVLPPLQNDVILRVTFMPRDQTQLQVHYFPSSFIVPPSAKPGHIIYHFKQTLPGNIKYQIIGGDNALGINATGYLFIQRASTFFRKKIGILVQSSSDTSCAFKEILIESQQGHYSEPKFLEDKVELRIPENTAVGSLVHKVSTKDDIPVLFSTANSSPWISIDPLTGWMSVTSPLDRETHEELEIAVVATHQHITSLSSHCFILISLTDYNDNPHIFNQEVYNVAVKEDAAVDSVLVQLALTDPDKHRAALTWDTGHPTFGVTSNFELVLLWPLDREKIPSYVLNATASDGVFTAITRVNVLVIDVNDERHRCLHPIYNVSILESQSPGYLVTTVLTSDPDLETNLIYRLSGLGSEKFSIDNHGEVRLRHFLDRETSSEYLLEASALDPTHPDWSCSSRIQMKIEDVNDNSPSFTINNETITMTEDAVVGMIVTQLQVLDFDEGENRQVHFTLVDSPGLFNVSSDTGILSLIRPLQSSPGSVHYVTAKVSDHGRPSLTSLTTLQVIVLGMNDDPPLLVSGAYHVSVSEDTPVFTSLLDIKAFSDDVERKFNVIYTILEGNGHGEFDVDKRSGTLSTCKTLDFEARQVYQLLILATSVGDSSLTSYVSVNVTVLDANDNPPIFKITRYTLQIREDVEVGQMILKVDADDVDSGRNGLVLFSLDESSRRYFGIDSLSGVLMVGSQLDRENIARHEVLVLATDQGIPPLSSTATVTIDVLDVNDNPPIFLHPNATAVLQADRLPGWAVFHFAVSDADHMDQSSVTPLSFRLTSGNEKDMFRVDPDGTLRTTDKLSVRLGDSFKLTVKVEDGGRLPVLHSSTWIYIKVVEPSKHPPNIVPLWVWVGVYEHQWQGGDLGPVAASDLDPYDKLEYSVSGTPLFTIEPRLGVLKARSSLAPGVYSVNVSVTDGKFSTSSLVSVTVELLLQDMLQSSIYIRLSPKMKQEVLVARLPVFLSTLRSAFLRDVSLISIQDIQNSTIGVLIAVTGGADLAVVREVMVSTGLVGTTPQCDCMNGGVCQRQLQMMPERTNIFSAPGLTFVTPSHSLAYYCICSMGYAGEHCEEVKCQCPPLQVCVPQRVGFACIPPCSANQTCPASMTSSVTWTDVVTYLCTLVGIIVTICALALYRKYKSSSGDRKYGSWGEHNCYIKKKTKLSNLEASQKPPIFTGSPNNGAISRNNLESTAGASLESETIPLDYLRNINPVTKMENDIIQGHSSAPDLATCHATDSFIPDDPARDLAELDDQLSQEVIEYGFPPPEVARTLPDHPEISL